MQNCSVAFIWQDHCQVCISESLDENLAMQATRSHETFRKILEECWWGVGHGRMAVRPLGDATQVTEICERVAKEPREATRSESIWSCFLSHALSGVQTPFSLGQACLTSSLTKVETTPFVFFCDPALHGMRGYAIKYVM